MRPDGTDGLRRIGMAPLDHGLEIRRVSEIVARPVNWLWPGRIARGKVTMLAGHPGLGKSQIALAIAAIVTTGGRWPVDGARAERGSVIIMSAEDDPEDTIRPRLEAAGADLSRCHVIGAVRDQDKNGRDRMRGFSLVDDLPRLEAALGKIEDVALVIIDPITAYLGDTDSHHNAEVRAVLAPLAELAAQHMAAILAISHLRKSGDGDAILRVSGSLAFVAAARAAYLTIRDPGDDTRRLLLSAKNNLGDDRTGYAFYVEGTSLPGGIETSRIIWAPEAVTMTADEALSQGTAARPRPKLDAAMDWLGELLARGPLAHAEIQAAAQTAGHAWATVRRAAKEIGVDTTKDGYAGGWVWSLAGMVPPEAEEEL
jgi:putative DNA primase/helicase